MSLWKSPWASEQGRTGPWLGSPWRSQRGRPIWLPSELFKNGEQGAWYDPSDLTTLYQDAAGTTPVTADGDPVGLMLDRSGNGNHASQSVSVDRPIYRTDGTLHWLQGNGVNQTLSVSGSDSAFKFLHDGSGATFCIAVKPNKENDPDKIYVFAGSQRYAGSAGPGFAVGFDDRSSLSRDNAFRLGIVSSTDFMADYAMQNVYAPTTQNRVVSIQHSSDSSPNIKARVDSSLIASLNYETQPSSDVSAENFHLFVAPQSVGFSENYFYGLILVDSVIDNVSVLEQYLAKKSGVTLP